MVEEHGGWRYQPVWQNVGYDPAITLCECYFDADDRLQAWTENPAMHPMGETVEELAEDLCRMLAAAYKRQPVAFADLHVGMTFERTEVNVEAMISAMNMARGID